ncbi:histidine phosphatase family protein [Chitinophaga silvatica]|uniref:Histidine phosphatase family protein n=1 Tax=Chitinophaga silvatica TaxID=2282649 RepID=A0A3E1YEE9_9BACT|nr:histidine phosphatase family protein [Chitinophaga silvatica]RFS24906.1 histidine phosphatase family protein [Chitinophaga silvatica]
MRIFVIFISIALVWVACKPKQAVKQPIEVSDDSVFLTGTFFVVRHAERNPGSDSTLTLAGQHRAGALYHLLKDSLINKIYITPFKRSIQTADSLRIYQHIDTCYYTADSTGESLIYQITRHDDWGKRILIIGHSTTIIPILRSLKVEGPLSPIHENDFERFYRVRMTREKSELTESCYP